jgi:hypothetical protein
MDLEETVSGIVGFAAWSHAQKIKFFGWYLHSLGRQERFTAADIRNCYDVLKLEKPSSIHPFLGQMEQRRPKEAIRDSRGYYLEKRVRDGLEAKHGQTTADPTPKTERVLPHSVVKTTRGYIEKVVLQANGCYERQWFDACSVMIRKLVEILIIESYEATGKDADIKGSNGDFLMLRDLISRMLKDASWNLSRESKRFLPDIKSLGDRSAHNRRYIATKDDVDKVIPGLRVIADDLLHLANLK